MQAVNYARDELCVVNFPDTMSAKSFILYVTHHIFDHVYVSYSRSTNCWMCIVSCSQFVSLTTWRYIKDQSCQQGIGIRLDSYKSHVYCETRAKNGIIQGKRRGNRKFKVSYKETHLYFTIKSTRVWLTYFQQRCI